MLKVSLLGEENKAGELLVSFQYTKECLWHEQALASAQSAKGRRFIAFQAS
jgi:hypothetical protein